MNSNHTDKHTNNTSRQFAVICSNCNAVNRINLDIAPSPRKLAMDDVRRVSYAFERIQHMRITLKLSRQRLAEHLVSDDILQTHLDSHVKLLETTYQLLLEVVSSKSKVPNEHEQGLIEFVNL